MRYIFITLLLCNIAYFIDKTVLHDGQKTVVSARPSVVGVESVYLLSENTKSGLRDRGLGLVVGNPITVTEGESGSCEVIGPFVDMFLGQYAVDRINAVELMVEMKALDVITGENDYRVMMPRSASLQGAFRKLRELKSQGINSYVITQGEEALSISLGVFSTRVAADSLQSKLLSDGYEVVVSGIPRLSRQFWMFPLNGENIKIDDLDWLTLRENHPNIEKKQLQCLET